jgi:hypothetical protein
MSYTTMRRCWDALREATLDNIDATLRDLGADLGMTGSPSGALLHGVGEPHFLLAVANDYSAEMGLWMIPESSIDDRLRDALATINGCTFAGSADLAEEEWDAAVLVMAALAYEWGDPAELITWTTTDESSVTPDEIRSYWNRWGRAAVSKWSELDRPVSTLRTFHRAM